MMEDIFTSKSLSSLVSDLDNTVNSSVNHTFICPYPLVHADSTKEYPDYYSTHWAYKHGNCAVRCPTIVLTVDEFHQFNQNVWIIALISCIFSLIVLAFHLPEASRYNIRIFFVAGFAAGSFAFAIFPPINTDFRIICSDDRAHYIPQNPLCVTQSVFIVFCFSWIALWGAIYSTDIYLVTSLTDPSFLKRLRKYYFWFALIVTIGITSAGLIADNYGYDYTTALPNCLYLFADNRKYFWTTLVLPYIISCVICLLASMGSAYRLQSVFVNSKVSSRRRMLRNVINTYNRSQAIHDQRIPVNTLTSSITPNHSSGAVESIELSGNERAHEPSIEYRRDWSVDIENSHKRLDSLSIDGLNRTPSDTPYNPIITTGSLQERPKLATVMEASDPIVISLEKSSLPSSAHMSSSPSESSSQGMSSFNIELKEEQQRITEHTNAPEREDDYVVSMISEDYISDLRNSLPRLTSQYSAFKQDDPDLSSQLHSVNSTNLIDENMIPESTANAIIRQITEKIIETWKYNGRIILFIFVYCLLSVYVIPVFVYLFHMTYDKNVDSAEEFIACLVTASFTSPIQTQQYVDQHAKEQCGEYPSPRPPFGLVNFLILSSF